MLGTLADALKQIEYVVIEDGDSRYNAWQSYNNESKSIKYSMEWIQHGGFIQQIGTLYRRNQKDEYEPMPVCAEFDFVSINGHLVCFIESSSIVYDYSMAEEWFQAHIPVLGEHKCKNSDFEHQCLRYCGVNKGE